MKWRHEFYLDEDLSERLATMVAKPGSSKTAIMTDALRAYLDRGAASEFDERFRARLDNQSLQLARIERDQQIVAETVALLARFQFLVTAPLPESDRAARSLAQERFKAFVEQVSRRIAGGHGLIEDVLTVKSASEAQQ
jgi:predicted transcriptional regulator